MPRSITQYRVFIGSPGGLKEERECFRDKLRKFSEMHDDDVVFHPVGWEDTLPGVGRPQEVINRDLEGCDYAVFVLHDWFGSPTGNGHASGTEEEFQLAEKLYENNAKIRNIALFFKEIDEGKLRDPGEQLNQVLAFKEQIESGRKYLFKQYADIGKFTDILEKLLIDWKKAHAESRNARLSAAPVGVSPQTGNSLGSGPTPSFRYWLAEASKYAEGEKHDEALVFSKRALETATTDDERAKAKLIFGAATFHLGKPREALGAFVEIVSGWQNSRARISCITVANALVNKGVTLGTLGRSEDEIAAYDDVLARFGAATAPALREQVAKVLFNKGVALDTLGRSEEAIAAYDDLVTRFGAATAPALREAVARGLFNKGLALRAFGRTEEALAVYNDLVARFGAASEPALREQVAKALVNKGAALGKLGRSAEAIAVCDDVVARFGAATEPALREAVAKARALRDRLQKP